jgi:hypothetical protein
VWVAGTHAGGRLAFACASSTASIPCHALWAAVVIIPLVTASHIALGTTPELRSFPHVCRFSTTAEFIASHAAVTIVAKERTVGQQ